MKPKIIIVVISLILGLVAYVIWDFVSPSTPTIKLARSAETKTESQGQRAQMPSVSSSRADEAEIDYNSLLRESEKAHMLATGHVLTEEDRKKLIRRKLGNDIEALMLTPEEIEIMMDTPVEFYGQVLDQFDQPVVGANIHCYWPYMRPPEAPLKMQSAAPGGVFEVLVPKAVSIHVFVSPPPGYDESVSDNKNIQIAKAPERVLKNEDYKKMPLEGKTQLAKSGVVEEPYKPDKTKPVIFRLKKL
jgi:hypothetical protein